jgi:hypothetical protein
MTGMVGRFALAMMLMAGCAGCAPGLRGDGTLAVVRVSDDLHALGWSSAVNGVVDVGDMVDAFCAGARLWDVVGAHVRCDREVANALPDSAVDAVADGSDYAQAWYSDTDRRIHVHEPRCGYHAGCAAVAAHEIGHALGLPHIADGNLMSPSTDATALTAADMELFLGRWPAAAR